MGKGSKRKRKQKKADFQKVKFKVGKKIPKGNVVDTTFKTKKILIREQLKAGDDGINDRTVPKKNIQEILKQINHLSPNVLQALNDLKKTLVARPELSTIHLSTIIGSAMSLCAHREVTVRKAAIAFLKHLFSSVESAHLVPHLHVIFAHVRCAMSHISQSVRTTALEVVDLIVEHFSGSSETARFSGQLLIDFVDQISDSRIQSSGVSASSSSSSASKPRGLTADPSTGLTSISWHLQVSRRLRAILRNILSHVNDGDDEESQKGRSCQGLVVSWNPRAPLHVPLLYKSSVGSVDSVNRKDLNDFFEDKNQMNSLFSNLIPLLFEMWVEAHSLNTGLARNLVSGESLEVYCCIVDVIQLLWKLVDLRQEGKNRKRKGSWFDDNFEKKFLAHCITGFPYADHSAPLRKKGKKAKANIPYDQGHNALSLNLSLCYVATCLSSFDKSPTSSLPTVWHYVLNFLEGDGWHAAHADTVDHVLRKFLQCKCDQTLLLLDAMHNLCSRLSVQRRERKQLLDLLHDLLTLPIYAYLQSEASLWNWVASLPKQLLRYEAGIPWEILKIFQTVAYRGHTKFLYNVQSNLPAILGYVLQHASMDSDWNRDCKVVTNLLYWIPQCDVNIFKKVCDDDRLTVSQQNYIRQMLDRR